MTKRPYRLRLKYRRNGRDEWSGYHYSTYGSQAAAENAASNLREWGWPTPTAYRVELNGDVLIEKGFRP